MDRSWVLGKIRSLFWLFVLLSARGACVESVSGLILFARSSCLCCVFFGGASLLVGSCFRSRRVNVVFAVGLLARGWGALCGSAIVQAFAVSFVLLSARSM